MAEVTPRTDIVVSHFAFTIAPTAKPFRFMS